MPPISKRLEQIISKELSKTIIPVKTKEGILVGAVLIENSGVFKNIKRGDQMLYEGINLNKAAVAIANLLAKYRNSQLADQIFHADREYGKWFADSQMLRSHYEKSLQTKDFVRADIMWARYQESRAKTISAKNKVENLSNI